MPHYWDLRGDSKGWVVQWSFPEHHGVWTFPEALSLRDLVEPARQGLKVDAVTVSALGLLLREMAGYRGMARLECFWRMLSMLVLGAETDCLNPLSARPFSLEGTAQQQEAIAHAVYFVLGNYRRGGRLEELLKLSGMSRATSASQSQRRSGKSFSAFIGEVRVQGVFRALSFSSTQRDRLASWCGCFGEGIQPIVIF